MTRNRETDALAKKLSLLYILRILRTHSDVEHSLSQQKIMQLLEEEYGMVIDRKAVQRNLDNLVAAGCPLECETWQRRSANSPNGFETVRRGWYYDHEFSTPEITTLIHSLLFSHLPRRQVKRLIEKLCGLQSKYYRNPLQSVNNIPNESWLNETQDPKENRQMFYTIEILSEAIEKKCQVTFYYLSYGPEKKVRRRCRDGETKPRLYAVSPYAVVATNSRFYLIANTEGHNDLSHYRLDRIDDVRLQKDKPQYPRKKVKGLKKGKLDLPRHLAEHVNMYAGPAVSCRFRAKTSMMDSIIDAFGKDIDVREIGDEVEIRLQVNEQAMYSWVLGGGSDVRVLAPQTLVERLREATRAMAALYTEAE